MTTRSLLLPSLTTLLLGAAASQALAADDPMLQDPKKKLAYSVGLNIGGAWKAQDVDFDVEAVARGIRDQLAGKPLLTEAEAREVMMAFQTEHRAKQEEKRKLLAEKNAAEGKAFLDANKSKPGIVTLPSGLQYKVIQEGTGETPKTTDRVTCHYRGTLIDGTEFDSSYNRPDKKPAEFPVTGVIKGWTEALQLMKVGSKWQLFIPADLAYGPGGRGGKIGPNATLIFELELLGTAAPAPTATSLPSGHPPVTSDIIKVPSAEELKKGAKIEVIKADDAARLEKERLEQQKKEQEKK